VNRVFIILGVFFLGAVIFVGMSMSGGAPRPTSTGTQDPVQVKQKILRLAIDTEPKTLDPIGITDTISDGVARKVFSTLVRVKKEGTTLGIEPDLAESYELSKDGKVYTFHLRKGVKFHNGREVKADDVVYSFKRLLGGESKRPEWLEPMVAGSEEFFKDPKTAKTPLGIKATDDYTFTIELTQPFAPFLEVLCTVNCAVVPREAVEDTQIPFASHPVGTGPFKLAEWKTNQVLNFVRNDGYFHGKPKLYGVRFRVIKEPNTRLENFFAGELHASDIPFGRVEESVKRAGEPNVLRETTFRTNYIGIGSPNGNFKDKEELKPYGTNKFVRQAIAHAIDRKYLCETILEGRGVPATGILPPQFPGYKERPGYPHDLAKAKALLAEGGHPDGKDLPPAVILYRNDENSRKLAQAIGQDLDKIGIQTDLRAQEWNRFLETVDNAPQQMFLLGWVADYPDPHNFLFVLFNSSQFGSPGNGTWYSNPKVDELTNKARDLSDMKERIPLYQQAEDIILDECPWVVTYYPSNVVLLSSKVKGIRENSTALDTGTEFSSVDFANIDIDE
jgi:oligopeptide transport system substrate-binding protein